MYHGFMMFKQFNEAEAFKTSFEINNDAKAQFNTSFVRLDLIKSFIETSNILPTAFYHKIKTKTPTLIYIACRVFSPIL